jgi:hypothetical protein
MERGQDRGPEAGIQIQVEPEPAAAAQLAAQHSALMAACQLGMA